MIIEVLDEATLTSQKQIRHNLALARSTLLESEIYGRTDSPEHKVTERRIEALSTKYSQLKPSTFYAPKRLDAHELHAFTGTQWTYDGKPEPQRTYPKGFSLGVDTLGLIMSVGVGIGLATEGNVAMSLLCCLFALLTLGAFAMESKTIGGYFHNRRIARVNVDDLTVYPLESRLTGGLRYKLGSDDWQRLVAELKSEDQELGRVFAKFCEGKTEYIVIADEAEQLFVRFATHENAERVDNIAQASEALTNDTVATIRRIFERHDVEALEQQQRAEEDAEHRASIKSIQDSLDGAFTGKVLDVKLEYMKNKY